MNLQKVIWWCAVITWWTVLAVIAFIPVPIEKLTYPIAVTMLWLLLRLNKT